MNILGKGQLKNESDSLLPQLSFPKLLKELKSDETTLLEASDSSMQIKKVVLYLDQKLEEV